MSKIKISSKTVADRLTCPEGKTKKFYYDETLEGFGIVVYKSQKKRYFIETKKLNLGRHTFQKYDAVSLEEAKKEARQLLAGIARGISPKGIAKQLNAIKTFEEVAELYITFEISSKRKDSTIKEYKAYLKNHLVPALGKSRIVDVTFADVQRVHDKLRDTPYMANRLLAFVSSMWNWAAKRGEVEAARNPAKSIERYPEIGRERYLTTEELKRLGDALKLAETDGIPWKSKDDGTQSKHTPKKQKTTVDLYAIAAIKLYLFTGARRGEILSLKWEYLDRERKQLNLPDSKTGKKVIQLNPEAIEVLDSLPAKNGNPYIIAGDKPGQHRADIRKPWDNIRRAANLPDLRLHDLRHAFASIGAMSSMGLPIIGKLLGHKNTATTNKYAHLDSATLQIANESIGKIIREAMD